jgi:hypothetical protein
MRVEIARVKPHYVGRQNFQDGIRVRVTTLKGQINKFVEDN